MPPFKKVVIFGPGLIGGSFALALKAANATQEIVGFGRRPASLREAQSLGIIERAGINPAHELPDADLILIATPIGQMPKIFAHIASYLGEETVITDAGSTKASVITAARQALGEHIGQFVPAHPIAGAENSGASAAHADLFKQRLVVLTPLPETSDVALKKVKNAWTLCGAKTQELAPVHHDEIFAAVSHLPHLLSFALVHELATRDEAHRYFDFAASGFRDFTRIAASHPEMWRDIFLANQVALQNELKQYQAALDKIATALQDKDGAQLEQYCSLASQARQKWDVS